MCGRGTTCSLLSTDRVKCGGGTSLVSTEVNVVGSYDMILYYLNFSTYIVYLPTRPTAIML